MALTPEQVAAFRAQAAETNIEIKGRLQPAVEALVEALSTAIVVANELVIVDINDDLRIRDTLISVGASLKVNLDQVVRPLLAPFAPPAA